MYKTPPKPDPVSPKPSKLRCLTNHPRLPLLHLPQIVSKFTPHPFQSKPNILENLTNRSPLLKLLY
jgi:hypothetical protein